MRGEVGLGEWNGTRVPRLRVDSVDDKEQVEEDDSDVKSDKERIKRLRRSWGRSAQDERKKCDIDSNEDEEIRKTKMMDQKIEARGREKIRDIGGKN